MKSKLFKPIAMLRRRLAPLGRFNPLRLLRRRKPVDPFAGFWPEAAEPVGRLPVLPPFHVPTNSPRWKIAKRTMLVALIFFCFVYGFFYALFTPYLMAAFAVPVAVLAGLTVWALPDMRHPPTRSLTIAFFAFLVGLFMWPNYLALALPGMPWITMIRLTGFPLVTLLLICLSVSKEFRQTLGGALAAIPWLWKLIIAFVVLQFALVAVSSHIMDSFQKVLIDQVNWTAIFFASCYVFQRPGRVEKFAALLWGMAVILSLVGVWEHHLGHVPWRDHVPSFLRVPDDLVQGMLNGSARNAVGEHRVQATASTPLGFAEFLALAVPFVVQFLAGKYDLRIRLAAAASVPLMLYAVIATDSRLGSVGFFLTLLLFPLVWAAKKWRDEKASLVAPAVVLSYPFLFGLAISAALTVHRLRVKLLGSGAQNASNQSRSDQWHMGVPKILSHPWGYGCSMSGAVLGYVATGSDMPTIDTYYLRLLLEYGVIGFVIYFAFIIMAIVFALKYVLMRGLKDREYGFLMPIAIALINFTIIKSVFSEEDNHPLMFMMLGAVVALVHRYKQTEALAPKPAARPAAARLRLLPSPAGAA